MDIMVWQTQRRGREYIIVQATAQSPETLALMRKFKKELKTFEASWKTAAKKAGKAYGARPRSGRGAGSGRRKA